MNISANAKIRVKAIGVHWRDGCLLAADVPDGQGAIVGVRPLGGSVEFGELSSEAVRREFKEEIGIDVEIVAGPVIIENRFHFDGADGHEIIFVYEVTFPSGAFAGEERVVVHDGVEGVARWHDPAALDRDGCPSLYPRGLKALLSGLMSTR